MLPGNPNCCLPCPAQNYFYPDDFQTLMHTTIYLNMVSVACCCFLLLSYAFLAVEYTRRHYLSVCLTCAILLMQTSFIIPFWNRKAQCFDKITPHDMFSSINCALSGALLLGGGFSTVMWAFLRTLSLHLQICWKVVPGRSFFLSAQAVGWSIPAVFLATSLSITGVSFRFGESCHINSKNGLQTFWGPLLAVSAASIVTQTITFSYCVHVYLRNLIEDKRPHQSGKSGLPYSNSVKTTHALRALRRVQRVIELQWRGITVICIIISDVVFFATVFLRFDGTTQRTPKTESAVGAWLMCMVLNGGDKNQCLGLAVKIVIAERTALAVMFLLSLNGVWALILLGQVSMIRGWKKRVRSIFPRNRSEGFDFYDRSEPSGYPDPVSFAKKRYTSSTEALSILKSESMAGGGRDISLQEYNPSTFSAHLRERSGDLTVPPTTNGFTPFRDDILNPELLHIHLQRDFVNSSSITTNYSNFPSPSLSGSPLSPPPPAAVGGYYPVSGSGDTPTIQSPNLTSREYRDYSTTSPSAVHSASPPSVGDGHFWNIGVAS